MNRIIWKTTIREIRSSFGRYIAILAIIALGVGFFSGLKVTRQTMVDAADKYIKELNMFDYRLVSTLGLEENDLKEVRALNEIEYAYGAYQADAIVNDGTKDHVARFHSLNTYVNRLSLRSGRLAEAKGEIVADARYYSTDDLGKIIRLSKNNTENNLQNFSVKEFKIVGTAYSPLYLNYERGNTSVGNGSVSCFYFVLPENFNMEVFTDIYVSLKEKEYMYSENYKNMIESRKNQMGSLIKRLADSRYESLYNNAKTELEAAKKQLDDAEIEISEARDKISDGKRLLEEKRSELSKKDLSETEKSFWEKTLEDSEEKLKKGENELEENIKSFEEAYQEYREGEKKLDEFKKPSALALTRAENIGYACFENDSSIVDGIAVVFPVFFFLVAALVCITTMSRMIEEQRTQIGILKALGYNEVTIMSKYMIYSGSAALIGCVGGFFVGCKVFPYIIWKVYGIMYGFTEVSFVFNSMLFIISIVVALICSVGTTWYSCKRDLKQKSAELLRPRAPKTGKRIFLEKIKWFWNRIPFLGKVSIRNTFRYKGRFFMMILGIGGCTGLLITGYGINDSITEIADEQFTQILIYDEQINFSEVMTEEKMKIFKEKYSDSIDHNMLIYQTTVDPVNTNSFRSATLTVLEKEEGWKNIMTLHTQEGEDIEYPNVNEVILTSNVAKANEVKKGDYISFRDSDYNEFKLLVSGVCENFFGSYAYINAETYCSFMGKSVPYKSAFVTIKEGGDLHEVSAEFMGDSLVSAVSVNADTMEMFAKMVKSMNYIVLLIIVCAAALAFIVLYNLTNINITERIREIATIKVLGFYSGETAAYVFRENLVLTIIGAVAGIPIGIALQRYVMWNIKIDTITFDVHINGISYIIAMLFTFLFALFVDLVMYFKIAKINMAESLKSIE